MQSAKPPPGNFTLLYFASATSFTKKDHEFFPAPLAAGQLFDILEEQYPKFKDTVLESCALTVNLEYVDLEEENGRKLVIKDGDEVAIIPPVSSG